MDVLGILLVAVLVVLGARALHKRLSARRGRSEVKALIEDCNGDQDLVERLIFAEMQRDERLTIHAAAKVARARLQRDRMN